MGLTKAYEFTNKVNKLVQYLKALGHPARIAILKLLVKRRSCTCGDVVEALPLSQSTVSQHIKELKEAGLVKGKVEGAAICYFINEKEWRKAQGWINAFFDTYKNRED